MHILLHIFTILVLLATLVPFIRSNYWAVRVFDYPMVQNFVLSTALLVTYFFFYNFQQDGLYVIFLSVNILYLGYLIFPYTKFSKKQVKDSLVVDENGTNISLVSWNVFQDNDEYRGIREIVTTYEPDIFVLLETDDKWADEILQFKHHFVDYKAVPMSNTYGMIVLSKLPFTHCEVNFLIDDEVPSIKIRTMITPEQEIEINLIHPKPPVPQESSTSTARDQELIVVGRRIQDSNYPTLVLGDLNDVAWSHTTRRFQQLSRLLDARKGRGLYNTFNAKSTFFKFPIDHIFVSEHFTLRHLETLPAFGSDHHPIHGIFTFNKLNKLIQKPVERSPEAEKEADEEMAKEPD